MAVSGCLNLKFSIPKSYNIQINTIRQSITQLLFYIQWYIYIYVTATCLDLVGHPQALQENRPMSCLVCAHYGIPNAYKFQLQKQNFIGLYKLNMCVKTVTQQVQFVQPYISLLL